MTRRAPKDGPRLRLWQEWAVYGLVAGLAATGAAWLWLHTFVTVQGEFGTMNHPAEHPLLVGHGVLGFGFLVLAGMLLDRHVPAAWKQRRHIVTGFSLLGAMSVAALSALGLYYLSDDRARAATSVLHWAVGLAAAVALTAHALARRQANGRARRGSGKPAAQRTVKR